MQKKTIFLHKTPSSGHPCNPNKHCCWLMPATNCRPPSQITGQNCMPPPDACLLAIPTYLIQIPRLVTFHCTDLPAKIQ